MKIILRKVTIDDAKFLYHLLKERPNYSNITHDKMPTWEEHLRFISLERYFAWYIVKADYLGAIRDVGAVYLTRRDEIGIAIVRKYWRNGFSKAAIRKIIETVPRDKYYANINPININSQKLFKKMDFKILQYTLVYDSK